MNAWLRLSRALLWRSFHQQGRRILLHPLLYAAAMLALWLIAFHIPGVLTPTTYHALARAAELRFGGVAGRAGLALALMFLHGPYLVALFSSASAAAIAQGTVGAEAARGGLELLAAAPYRARTLFLAFFVHSFVLTAITWAALVAGFWGSSALALALSGSIVDPSRVELGLALFVPLPLALWANLISLWIALRHPRLGGGGPTMGVSRFVAVAPALGFLLAFNLRPELDPARLAIWALLVGATGTALLTLWMGRSFRFERLLGA